MRILIVDDERLVRFGLRDMISELDISVTAIREAENGKAMLEVLKTFSADAVFVDIRMPVMDGFSAIEEAEAIGHECIWIILSSYSEFDYARKAINLRVLKYLLKPVAPEELNQVLRKVQSDLLDRRQHKSKLLESFLYRLFYSQEISVSNEIKVFSLLCSSSSGRVQEQLTKALKTYFPEGVYAGLVLETGDFLLVADVGMDRDVSGTFESEHFRRNIQARLNCAVWAMTSEAIESPEGLMEWVKANQGLLRYGFLISEGSVETAYEFAEKVRNASGPAKKVAKLLYLSVIESPTQQDLFKKQLKEDLFRLYNEDENSVGPVFYAALRGWKLEVVKDVSETIDRLVGYACSKMETALEKKGYQSREEAIVSRVQNYVKKYFAKDIGIAQIAEQMELTPNYLSAVFKAGSGETFVKFLTRIRMEHAAEILKKGDRKVAEVAQLVGYYSHRHFSKKFRELMGVYPADYGKG